MLALLALGTESLGGSANAARVAPAPGPARVAAAPGPGSGGVAPAGRGASPLLAPVPYMGWNTYYGVGGIFDEGTILSVAGRCSDRGLAAPATGSCGSTAGGRAAGTAAARSSSTDISGPTACGG